MGCLNLNSYIGKKVQKIFLWVSKFAVKLGVEIFFSKIPKGRTVFNFSCKTSSFVGGFSFFLSFFCHFFMQKFSFLRGWMVFLCKKRHFFSCKTSAFEGLGGHFE